MLRGQVTAFGKIGINVVKLPIVVIEGSVWLVKSDRFPTLFPDGAMSPHLVILNLFLRRCRRVSKSVGHTHPFDGQLWDSLIYRRGFYTEYFEDRWYDVHHVMILVSDGAFIFDTFRPGDNERIANPAAVRILFISFKGCIACLGPA